MCAGAQTTATFVANVDLLQRRETIMQWISENWVWVLFFVAFIGMHLFGHGGHGGHGGGTDRTDSAPADQGQPVGRPKTTGHQH